MDCSSTEHEKVVGLTNNDMNIENQNLPASFRVIGVGHGVENRIDKVRSFGFEGVSTEVVKYPFDCTPDDEDKIAIIVFTDCDDNANRIANTFHDAGVLTIGFNEDAVPSCYDSIMNRVSPSEIPEIIKTLLQPIVTPCLISYDFNDLSTILRDSGYFTVKSATGNNIKQATDKLEESISECDLQYAEHLALHLYYNPNRPTPIAMSDMANLQEFITKLPETVTVLWSVNHDDKLDGDEIRMSAILAGKELWRCQ